MALNYLKNAWIKHISIAFLWNATLTLSGYNGLSIKINTLTWWYAERGRMVSDPSASQWKLWFSVIQPCPSLVANSVRWRRMKPFIKRLCCMQVDWLHSIQLLQIKVDSWTFEAKWGRNNKWGVLKYCILKAWLLQHRLSYQVVRHGSIVGNSKNLCEEDGIAIPSNPQIDHLL